MPVRKEEAHRALELLEEYHSKLTSPRDKQLRNALERVLRIFKSRLFQALLDIQEFYEITLLNEDKTTQQKTAETLQIASKWESDPLISPSVDTDSHSRSLQSRSFANCSNPEVKFNSRGYQNDESFTSPTNERSHLHMPDNLNLNLAHGLNAREERLEEQHPLQASLNQYNKQACVSLNQSPSNQDCPDNVFTGTDVRNENMSYYICHPPTSHAPYILHDSRVLPFIFI